MRFHRRNGKHNASTFFDTCTKGGEEFIPGFFVGREDSIDADAEIAGRDFGVFAAHIGPQILHIFIMRIKGCSNFKILCRDVQGNHFFKSRGEYGQPFADGTADIDDGFVLPRVFFNHRTDQGFLVIMQHIKYFLPVGRGHFFPVGAFHVSNLSEYNVLENIFCLQLIASTHIKNPLMINQGMYTC